MIEAVWWPVGASMCGIGIAMALDGFGVYIVRGYLS